MYPVQSYMNAYPQNFPQQRNESSYPYHNHPSWNSMFPRMRMDLPNPPTDYEPWPHNSYAYPQCNGCCSHGYAPGHFGFRPPYTHPQPPSQCYYPYVPHPPYPDGFSANSVPPPYFPAQQQVHYERDKDQHHCCGCPNHKCIEKKDTFVKIEEENPEGEYIESNKLIQNPNYSRPMIQAPQYVYRDGDSNRIAESHPGYWFPFDLSSLNGMKQGGEQKKASTQLAHPKHLGHKEASGSSDSHPSFWLPLDLSGLKASSPGEENSRQSGEENSKRTPLPIFWFPNYSKPETDDEEHKEVNPSSKVSEQTSPRFKILPLGSVGNENAGEKSGVAQLDGDKKPTKLGGVERESKVKTIPVKQVDENGGTKLSMSEEVKGKKEQKPVANEMKDEDETKPCVKKDASPVKTFKLPPVCLRVDPLPKKRRSNGNSSSLSPPGQKDKTLQDNKDRIPLQQDENDKLGDDERKVTGQRIGGEDMGIVKETEKHVDKEMLKQNADSNVYVAELENKGQKESKGQSSTVSENVERKNVGRVLSPTDASVIIQSAFRGYEVRRWQPLEKLRKIALIRLHADDIRKKISDAEASKQLDQKEKVAIGETIMNLLLQLDTIQGLHPSVREIRKSMVKELVCLQEKLDLLGSQASEELEVEKFADANVGHVEYQITPISGTLEAKQPKDVHGLLSNNEAVETSPKIKEHADEKAADSDSLLAGHLPSSEDCNSREGAVKENFEELSLAHIDGQSVPANCNLENEQKLASTMQPKEVEELTGTMPKIEEDRELQAAENQDSDSIFESKIESSAAVQSNIELPNGQEPVSDGAASKDGCLLTVSSDGHEDQLESPMQATETTLENTEVPDLTVIELPEFSEHKQDSSGASTSLQEEEEKEELELAVPVTNNASTEVSKDQPQDLQDSSTGSTLQKEEEELELAVPVMDNASPEVYQDMVKPDLPELYQEMSKYKEDLSRASTDLHEEEKEEQELAAPVMKNESTEVNDEITGFATERQIQDATRPFEDLKMVEESLSKGLEEQVASANSDGGYGCGGFGDGVVNRSPSDAGTEAAHRANTKVEVLDSVTLDDGLTLARNDYCTSEDDKRTTEELGNCDGTGGQFEVSDAQDVAEYKGEEDALVMPSEEHNDDAFNGGTTTEAPNAASGEKDVLHLSPGVVSTSGSYMVSHETQFPQSEGSSADFQAELLGSPKGAAGAHSIALNSEKRKLLEENEKLREMLERLLEAGKQQLQVISDLNGRIEHLERKLSQKGKSRAKRYRLQKSPVRKTVSPAA